MNYGRSGRDLWTKQERLEYSAFRLWIGYLTTCVVALLIEGCFTLIP